MICALSQGSPLVYNLYANKDELYSNWIYGLKGRIFYLFFNSLGQGVGKMHLGQITVIAYYYIKCLEIYTNDTLTTFIALNPAQNDIEYTYSVKNAISFYFRYSI